MVFDHDGSVVAVDQVEHEQIFPKAGWVEHDAQEIWENTRKVIGGALSKANLNTKNIAAVGITNQRETAIVWDKTTGEPVYNAIVWQDTRTQKIVDKLAERRWHRQVQGRLRPAAGDVLRRPEGDVDPGERRGRQGEGRERRPALRHHRLLGAVEPHRRRRERRRAHHRRHQRQPHDADGPRDPGVGRVDRLRHGDPDVDAPGDQVLLRGVRRVQARRPRRHARSPASSATSRPPPSARPAWRRAGQEHLRHRQLHAAQHRHRGGAERERSAHDGLLQARRGGHRLRPRGLDRGHRLARAVGARQPRDDLGRLPRSRSSPSRSTTTAAPTSCPRSPASSLRTGVRRPRRAGRADPLRQQEATSPGRCSRRPPSRPARCSTR